MSIDLTAWFHSNAPLFVYMRNKPIDGLAYMLAYFYPPLWASIAASKLKRTIVNPVANYVDTIRLGRLRRTEQQFTDNLQQTTIRLLRRGYTIHGSERLEIHEDHAVKSDYADVKIADADGVKALKRPTIQIYSLRLEAPTR